MWINHVLTSGKEPVTYIFQAKFNISEGWDFESETSFREVSAFAR